MLLSKCFKQLEFCYIKSHIVLLFYVSFLTCVLNKKFVSSEETTSNEDGRIKQFDDIIYLHMSDIINGQNMKYIVIEGEKLAHRLKSTHNKELVQYYVHLLTLIRDHGMESLRPENDRLEVIIDSAMSQSSSSRHKNEELFYARQRRNILTSFFDAAADYTMRLSPNQKYKQNFGSQASSVAKDL